MNHSFRNDPRGGKEVYFKGRWCVVFKDEHDLYVLHENEKVYLGTFIRCSCPTCCHCGGNNCGAPCCSSCNMCELCSIESEIEDESTDSKT